jgi:type VI secretion system protein ImpL
MSQQRRERMAPGVFTFPQEFATIRAPLRAFLATLFEENPYQFKPVFRGYYFTSALQEGGSDSAQAGRLAQRFALASAPVQVAQEAGQAGFFLLQLFRQVIFADKDLVTHYASRQRMRVMYGAFFAAALLLGTALGGWSWSYLANRQLVSNVQADLDKVVRLQASAPICRLGWKLWRYCRTGWNSWNATVASGRGSWDTACIRAMRWKRNCGPVFCRSGR